MLFCDLQGTADPCAASQLSLHPRRKGTPGTYLSSEAKNRKSLRLIVYRRQTAIVKYQEKTIGLRKTENPKNNSMEDGYPHIYDDAGYRHLPQEAPAVGRKAHTRGKFKDKVPKGERAGCYIHPGIAYRVLGRFIKTILVSLTKLWKQ